MHKEKRPPEGGASANRLGGPDVAEAKFTSENTLSQAPSWDALEASIRSEFDVSFKRLSELATSRTQSARTAAAWRAAVSCIRALHARNGERMQFHIVLDLVHAHGRNGPVRCRLKRLDAWRVVVDAMHSEKLKRGAA